jgi:hypothetical protein
LRLAFLLLWPAFVSAQPFIGPEIASAPLPGRNAFLLTAAPSAAMARDECGVVIAWTARNAAGLNRLYVGRLDSTAQLNGEPREIAIASAETADVDTVSIAPLMTGVGFALAWVELGSTATAVFSSLDGGLNQTPPRILTAADIKNGGLSVVVRSGRSTWIAANGLLWRYNIDGSLEPFSSGIKSSDMVAVTDFPIAVASIENQVIASCSCGGPHLWVCPAGCAKYSFTTSIQVLWLYSASATQTFGFETAAQPAIGSNGNDLILAWFDGAQRSGGAVTAWILAPADISMINRAAPHEVVLGSFGADSGPTRPDIATDGNRYVVVWRDRTAAGDYDVVGASIDHEDKVTYLPIATSPADESDPSVISVGDGRFLVAYEKRAGGERRIAGRFIDFGNRQRAVR